MLTCRRLKATGAPCRNKTMKSLPASLLGVLALLGPRILLGADAHGTANTNVLSPAATSARPATIQHATFRGLRPTDPGGRNGLRNPERGLRIETLIAAAPGKPEWGPAAHLLGKVPAGFSDEWWVADCAAYEPWGLTLAQTYVYLDAYVDGPIPAEKLAWLQASFDELRRNGLKAVLRFAYERDMGGPAGPTLDRVLRHLEQLTPVIRRNVDVIFVMQAGFVGAWGEWHSSKHKLEADHAALARIVAKVLEVLPPGRLTQVRVPKYKRWVLEQPILGGFVKLNSTNAHAGSAAARIGFNNDGFLARETCGGTWTEPPHFSNPGNPEFDYMTEESPYLAIDGELFWSDQGGKLDGLRAAQRIRLHHYSSLSLAHSYSGREGKPYSIDDWVRTPLTADQVRAARLPLSDGYFQDDQGKDVPRTQFEYVRDHLGYRIELQSASFPAEIRAGDKLRGEVRLVNRGFSTLHNPRRVLVALIGRDGDVHALTTEADPRAWQPFAPADPQYTALVWTISLDASLPDVLAPGDYRIGLWLPDAADSLRLDPRYAVRVANREVPWWLDRHGKYGINVLRTLRVGPGGQR